MVDDGEMFGTAQDRSALLDRTVVILSQDQLRQVRNVYPKEQWSLYIMGL